MANIKSAVKRAKKSVEVGRRNASVKTGFRSLVRTFNELLERDPAAAQGFLPSVNMALDLAAGKKVIHPNTAARKKTRLARRLKAKLTSTGQG